MLRSYLELGMDEKGWLVLLAWFLRLLWRDLGKVLGRRLESPGKSTNWIVVILLL